MQKTKKYLLIIVLVIALIVLGNYTYTFAKYVANTAWDYHLQSKGFYLSSEQLSAEGHDNVNNLWNGESTYFNINNAQNDSLITDYDIKYKVSCEIINEAADYAKCLINGSEEEIEFKGTLSAYESCINNKNDEIDVSGYPKSECEVAGYKWTSQKAISNLYFDIVLADNNYELSDVKVQITLTSTSPYKKTLTGNFNLKKVTLNEDTIVKSYLDMPISGRLTLTNLYNEAKCVNVTWNSDNLLIDEEGSAFSSYKSSGTGYINEINILIPAKSNLSYLFYKVDQTKNFEADDFYINENAVCE